MTIAIEQKKTIGTGNILIDLFLIYAFWPVLVLGALCFGIFYVFDVVFLLVRRAEGRILLGKILLYTLILLGVILYIIHKINIILSYF